jgi:K+ transporter
MGFCVPFSVVHTSRSIISHIYVPAANYFLLALTLAVTIGFQSSDHITDAYGVTVCSVMVITTILYMMVMRYTWSKPIWLVILFGIFLIIDLYTFAAICTTKIGSGGWVAIIIASSLFIFSFSWYYGNIRLKYYLSKNSKTNLLENLPNRLGLKDYDRTSSDIDQEELDENSTDDEDHGEHKLKYNNQESTKISLVENFQTSILMENIEDNQLSEQNLVKTPGVGCFLTRSRRYTPYVFETFLSRMHAHQQILIFLKLDYARMPNIDDDQRLIVRAFGTNIYHITSIFGYTETNINLFSILHLARQLYDVPITENESTITFFLPNETTHVNTTGWKTWLRRWPLYLYSILKSLYPGMPLNFKSIPENTIKVGILADL